MTAGRLSDLRPVGRASRRLRRLLPFRRDARGQPRLRYRPHGRGGRARAGAGRRVLGEPFSARRCREQQRHATKEPRGIPMFKRSEQDNSRAGADLRRRRPPSRRAGRHRLRRAAGLGRDARRATAVSGAPRPPYCMMGVCFECLVTIDGVGNRQGCLMPVAEGMQIETQKGNAGDRRMNQHDSQARSTTTSTWRSSAPGPPASPPPRPPRGRPVDAAARRECRPRRPGLSRHRVALP